MSEYDALIAAATKVRENAHAKFSNFKVGAALHTTSGKIFPGCNIENATYGLTLCAERVKSQFIGLLRAVIPQIATAI